MKVHLTNSDEFFLIDEADYEMVSQFNWRVMNTGYVASGYMKGNIDTFKLLHRYILGLGKGRVPEVDHINRNKLDNTRANLRIVDRSTNILNCGDFGNRELPKGVYQLPSGKYRAMIRLNGVLRSLGCFVTVEEAITARTQANPLTNEEGASD